MKARVARGEAWGLQTQWQVEHGPCPPGTNTPSHLRYSDCQTRYFYAWNARFPAGFEFLNKRFLNRVEALNYATRIVERVRSAR